MYRMMAGRGSKTTRASLAVSDGRMFAQPFDVRRKLLARAVAKLGLKRWLGDVDAYQLRHGGASFDFVSKARGLEEVRRRGRWRSWTSVRRYEKGSRVSQMLNRLPPEILDRAMQCASSLGALAVGRHPPLVID